MRAGSHHRVAAFSLVTLFVLGQAALFAHQLLVPHRACAEHGGELIHVGATRAAPAPDAPAWSVAQVPEAPHSHDHCLAFHSRRHDVSAAFEQAVAPVPAAHPPAVVSSAQAPATERVVLLRLAPKSSPPV